MTAHDYNTFIETIRKVSLEIDTYGDLEIPNIQTNSSLNRYSVARLGGLADVLIDKFSNNKQLQRVVETAWKFGFPTRIIGDGANLLFSDRGFRGVIIVSDVKYIVGSHPPKDSELSRWCLRSVGAGTNLIQFSRKMIDEGCSGLEWAISVPGTVGGAVVNNAGAYGSDIAANLAFAGVICEPGSRYEGHISWTKDDLQYGYRTSVLKRANFRYVVTDAYFKLEPGHDPAALRAKADEYLAHRKRTQPPGASLGSMFKNPPGDYAGRLLETAGLKGTQRGGVMISPVHANFFINTGGGTAADYLALIRLAQETVADKFGVKLELEIELVGEGFEDIHR